MNMHPEMTPVADESAPTHPLAARLGSLANKRVGFVDNSKLNADRFLVELRRQLVETYGICEGPSIRKLAPKDRLSPTDLTSLAQCDAVIQCFGDCGTSTSVTVADAVDLELAGVATATVFSTAFVGAAKAQASGRGMPDLPVVEVPHPMHTAFAPEVISRADAAVPALVDRLTAHSAGEKQTRASISPNVHETDNDQEALFAKGWTDGLPVVIPTGVKLELMLSAVERDAAELIGPIPPSMTMATIEKLAINAVMAGCLPDYFPTVLATVEAAIEDAFQLYSIQTATNTTAPLIVVNGPIIDDLGFNARGNVFGQGNRPNATVGRALQLILRNVGGDLPGITDASTHGQAGKFTACIAEAETDSPWDPLHVEAGFSRADSTVTLIGASAPQNIFTYGCENGAEIMEHFIGAMTGLGHNNIIFPSGPLLIISPEHAATLHRDGYSKSDIRTMVFERARIPLSRFGERTVHGLHHRRSRWFERVGDDKHIGVADSPSDVHIVVSGGAGIHSLFVPTAFSHRLVTKKIPERILLA